MVRVWLLWHMRFPVNEHDLLRMVLVLAEGDDRAPQLFSHRPLLKSRARHQQILYHLLSNKIARQHLLADSEEFSYESSRVICIGTISRWHPSEYVNTLKLCMQMVGVGT